MCSEWHFGERYRNFGSSRFRVSDGDMHFDFVVHGVQSKLLAVVDQNAARLVVRYRQQRIPPYLVQWIRSFDAATLVLQNREFSFPLP